MGFPTCLKYIVIIINVLFSLFGLAVTGLGAYLHIQGKEYPEILIATIVLTVIGSLVFVVSSCGCCGANLNSQCLLIMHGIVLLLLMIAKIAVAVIILINLANVISEILMIFMVMQEILAPHTLTCDILGSSIDSLSPIQFQICSQPALMAMKLTGYIFIGLACLDLIMVIVGLSLASHVGKHQHREYR